MADTTPLHPPPFKAARCLTCFAFANSNGKAGECRMDVPFLGEKGGAVWPRVKVTDWCMHHQDNAVRLAVD